MMSVNRIAIAQRIKEYNPDLTDLKLATYCAIFERVLKDSSIKFADSSTSDSWTRKYSKASWSVELETDYESNNIVNIEEEICNALAYESTKDLYRCSELGYIQVVRAVSDITFSPRISIVWGGVFDD